MSDLQNNVLRVLNVLRPYKSTLQASTQEEWRTYSTYSNIKKGDEIKEMIREGKNTTAFYIDKELHHKLCMLCMVRKFFFGDKTGSKSMIVNEAIKEYFINHRTEIEKLMDDYHEQGGCGELELEDLDE